MTVGLKEESMSGYDYEWVWVGKEWHTGIFVLRTSDRPDDDGTVSF